MGLEDYVSEVEAIQRSGVSLKTLQRFVEAGYLSVEIEPDGLRLYSRTQLDEIFGIHSAPISLEPIEEDQDGNPREPEVSSATPAISHTSDEQTPPQNGDFDGTTSEVSNESYYQAPSDSAIRKTHTHQVASSIGATVGQDREITKLKNVIELQETLLDSKDAEIKELREERQWLRTRIEKLEEKGERDQILLLSETQTIRKLIVVNERKQSPVKQFLTWVGLIPPQNETDTSTQDLLRATPVRELRANRTESNNQTPPQGTEEKRVGNG